MNEEKNAVIVSEEYTRAVTLTRSIIANAQAAQQSLYEVCRGLKEMRDGKLYKELGYQNFADFCENETGIKISQAKKYVAIADRMTDETASQLAKISTEKLYMLAMLDEPTRQEITTAVDVESVTVKELKAQITMLTTERDENEHAAELLSEELSTAKDTIEKKDKQFKAALESKQNELDDFRAGAKRRQDMLLEKNKQLTAQVQELENRPVVHDVVDNAEELEALRQERDAAKTALSEAQKQLSERPMVQEALPVQPMTITDSKGVFKAYLTAASDGIKRLCEFLEQHAHDDNMPLYLDKSSSVITLAIDTITALKGES